MDGLWECIQCGYISNRIDEVTKHIGIVHPLTTLTIFHKCEKVFTDNIKLKRYRIVNIGNMGNCVQADQHVSSPLDGNCTDITQNMDLVIAPSELNGW